MHFDMSLKWMNESGSTDVNVHDVPDTRIVPRRGDIVLKGQQAKIKKYAKQLEPEGFTAGIVDLYGFMGPDLRNALRTIAEATTYSSVMDLGFSPADLEVLVGLNLNLFYAKIAVAARKGVSTQLRMIALNLIPFAPKGIKLAYDNVAAYHHLASHSRFSRAS